MHIYFAITVKYCNPQYSYDNWSASSEWKPLGFTYMHVDGELCLLAEILDIHFIRFCLVIYSIAS